MADLHPSALKHGIAPEDIDHAVRNAMTIDVLDDDHVLILGPARDGALLELVAIVRAEDGLLLIHAMSMRPKFRRLLGGA